MINNLIARDIKWSVKHTQRIANAIGAQLFDLERRAPPELAAELAVLAAAASHVSDLSGATEAEMETAFSPRPAG